MKKLVSKGDTVWITSWVKTHGVIVRSVVENAELANKPGLPSQIGVLITPAFPTAEDSSWGLPYGHNRIGYFFNNDWHISRDDAAAWARKILATQEKNLTKKLAAIRQFSQDIADPGKDRS